MTDPGVIAALGIEAVEWLDEAGDRVTVRVSGRWRRRPTATGQPWLVVEAHGERHRFPAMPEPPGLSGTLPGTWRMSFRVPADIARAPNVRTWLQLGAALVPLPAEPTVQPTVDPAVEPIPPALEPRAVGVHELEEAAMEEQLRDAERALESERARAAAAETAAADLAARIAELGHEIEQREAEVARLGRTLSEREHSLRTARQRAHAEEMVRLELVRERDRLEDMLEASRLRVDELEDDLAVLRRRADEAEHLAAAARRVKPPTPVALPGVRVTGRARAYAAERSLARLARGGIVSPPVMRLPPRPVWSERERELLEARSRRSTALAAPAAPAPAAPAPPALVPTPTPAPSVDLAATLEALRGELTELRTLAEREREGRAAAEALSERLRQQLAEQEARSARAFAALDELRDQIDWVRQAYASLGEAPAAEPEPEAKPAPELAPAPEPLGTLARNGGFEFHRLDAARSRLREQTPALPDDVPPGAAEPDTRPPFTLGPLAERDPDRAGTLLTELLPAQGIVYRHALAYDLVLDPSTCVRVTVTDDGATDVRWMHTSRAREDVRFQLEGDRASIVRLLTAGAIRRRLRRRRLARLRGDRAGLEALRALLNASLPIPELERAGVSIEALDLGTDVTKPATSG